MVLKYRISGRRGVQPGPADADRPRVRQSLRGPEAGCLPPVPSHHGDPHARGWGGHPLHPSHARPPGLSTTQIYTQVSIRALQAVHAATHPGATNSRHRSVPAEFSTAPDVDGDSADRSPDGDIMSDHQQHVEVLFSVLEQEIDQENRADPGSPEATLPRRRRTQ